MEEGEGEGEGEGEEVDVAMENYSGTVIKF